MTDNYVAKELSPLLINSMRLLSSKKISNDTKYQQKGLENGIICTKILPVVLKRT